MRWISRLTTGAVILIIVAGLGLLLRAKVPTAKVAGTFKTYAKFRDASRIAVGSPVVIAGVQVGLIRKLTVEGMVARIDMELQDGLDLPVESFATRRADSLFGDSYVEVIPVGDVGSAKLKSGDPITHVIEGSSTDALLRAIDTSLPQIDHALDSIHDRVIQGRRWVSGPAADKLNDATDWLAEGKIEGPLERADQSLTRIDRATERAADKLGNSSPNVRKKLDDFNRAIIQARAKMNDTKVSLANALADARDGIDRVDPAIDDAAEIMASINDQQGQDWKGKLGKLISDPVLGEQIDEATSDLRDGVASFNRFKSFLGMRFEFNVFSGLTRFYATAEIQAHTDKFYLIEVERGPLGALPGDQLSDALGTDGFTRRQTIEDKPRYTAQIGKRFDDLALRVGLKDSTFGAGADYTPSFLGDRLKLSADIYGSFDATPRLKLSGAFQVFRTLYILGGVDDALNTPGYLPVITANPGVPKVFDQVRYGRDYFIGGTLSFTDADLSVLLRVYGALIVGLIMR